MHKIEKIFETFFRKNVRAGYQATEVIEFLTPTPHHAVIEIMGAVRQTSPSISIHMTA